MGKWFENGPGAGAHSDINEVGPAIDDVDAAVTAHDVARLKSACQSITDPLTIQLPTSVPAPDADVTNALTVLTENGRVLASACAGLDDPPTKSQLDALQRAMRNLGTNLKTTGALFKRDGQVMMNAG